ncbi:HAD family hydrolase [Saccharopolyspora hirsuta]|uniref:HAD family hydrolase n=1 Tax=Saccharopolyspora hirsuta TaxID=1837 RepID=A0A5M7C465_SACHI|nr:HAD family hydrolase [Saccharopolyspora hirsuta]KAA5835058.1 HAD family hydrolase [Saccharopolyspora hirsuta]
MGAAGASPLERAERLLSDGSCSVLSLDVFDTILWRRVPRPTDLFGMLGARLRGSGRCPEWVTDATFRRMRIEAEQRARHASGSACGEVSLFDIWREMPQALFAGTPLEELVGAEVELEREVTVVDLDVARLVQVADKNHIPIVLVSDTYFTADQLAHLLDRPELGPLRDARVFRSHQHGLDKGSGLWKIVLHELGMSPEQVVHVGDNEVADHEVPGELGVRTVHYRRIDEEYAEVLDREGASTDSFGPFSPLVHAEDGDFGLTSLRAKTLQTAPGDVGASVRTAWRYGAAVLGPVLTGFAEWVASRAHASGTPVVWCPMREGELLSELVNNAARVRGWNVTAKPIWLSRHITSIAALDCFDHDSVRDFIRRSYRLTVGQLLASLKLRPGDVPSLADQLGTLLNQPDVVDRVTVALTESPHLTNRLASTVTAARERLLLSLRRAGALDAPELPLVDLGWGGTIQFQLDQVLRRSGTGVRPSGFYLATNERATRLYLAGLRSEAYLGQMGHPQDVVHALSRSPEVVEQCVSARCGSLLDFAEDGSPELGAPGGSPAQDLEWRAVQYGIAAFQEFWNRYVAENDGAWPELTSDAAARWLAGIVCSAVQAPTAAEAAVFGNWQHEDNFGSSVVTRILPDDLVPAVPYLSPPDLDDLDMRDAFWPELLAASDPQLSAAVRAVRSGAVDPAVFEQSGPPAETRLRFRTPDDEWWDGPRKRVRINHNGLSFARLNFESEGATDISLAIPGRPAIVRVDWIEVTAFVSGDPNPRVLRWERGEDFAGLVFADCTWLGGNLVEFHAPHAAVWLPLATRAGGPIASAQVTIAFAVLPQSMSGFAPRLAPASGLARVTGRAREEYRARGLRGVAAGAARIALRQLGGR